VSGSIVVLATYFLSKDQSSGQRPREKRRQMREARAAKGPLVAWLMPEHGSRAVQLHIGCIALLALAALYRSTLGAPEPYLSLRNFYGAVRVYRVGPAKVLANGRTLHGAQLDPPNDKVPVTYYGKTSGIGAVLQNHPRRSIPGANLRVGLVGLGAGTLAAYGKTGDYFRYYEINPQVVKLSSDPQPVFTYLRDSAARVDVEQGDARLLLEQELESGHMQKFDVLVLDAFSGDAIPVHLLTKEAFETYWKCVDSEGGIIAVHVTSRHVNLLPVLQGADAYFHGDLVYDVKPAKYPYEPNTWVLLARHSGVLEIKGVERKAFPPESDASPVLWTDDYSSIVGLIK